MNTEKESAEKRVERLMRLPNSSTIEDVNWMAHRVQYLEGAVVRGTVALKNALKQGGFVEGLRTAAQLVEAASRKSVQIRTTLGGGYGKKQQTHLAVNEKMMLNTASLIRRYADDQESGKLEAMDQESARRKRAADPGSASCDPNPDDQPPEAGIAA